MPDKIFVYDREAERKSGAFTLAIFSFCLLLSTLFIVTIDCMLVDLCLYFLSSNIPIFTGLKSLAYSYIYTLMWIVMGISIPMTLLYVTTAIFQTLRCYVQLADGSFVRLKWQPYGSRRTQAYILSSKLSQHVPSSRKRITYRTLKGLSGIFDGISMIQDPKMILDYLNGTFEFNNIECHPLENMRLIKKTKSKIVIMADTVIKGKPKRKKIKIYLIYNNMEILSSICEGGIKIECE